MRVVADLHVHTTASDGTLDLEEVCDLAAAADLRAVAVTDHDRPHPAIDRAVHRRGALLVIHGIELRVRASDGQRLDLLGFGLERTPDLERLIDRLQTDRIERAGAIVEAIEDHEGISLDLPLEAGIGRPHIARAVEAHPATGYTYQEVFDRLIGTDRPCYVSRSVPTFAEGARVLSAACGLVGLAHPLRYEHPAAALERASALDCVERWYPYEAHTDSTPIRRAIERHGFRPTGGSDAHGTDVGSCGMPASAYDRFQAALHSSDPQA